MSRPRQKIDPLGLGPELLARYKNEAPGWQRERLLAIKLAMEGIGTQQVSDHLGRSQATVQSWINRFRSNGIEGLLSKGKGNGPASRLTPEMEQAMKAELAKGQWRTARDAWKWLASKFDLGDMKETTIYKYLGKCAGRLKATRPCNPQKDLEAEAAFRVTLADQMTRLTIPAELPVRLWVYDEMRYGLHPLTRKMWCLRGVRAIAPSRRRYANSYLYGALEVGGGGSEFLFTPALNKQWDLGFLEQIAAHDPEAIHIVIGDGAGFHHRKDEQELPEKIRIITLPAYSPELNPVEKLWDIVKDGICNRDWADLDEIEKAITVRIKPYWEDAQSVARLIGNGYLRSELNAIWKIEFRQHNH